MLAPFLLTTTTLLHSLNPTSVPEHLALYELYPESDAGQKALSHAWKLLGKNAPKNLSELKLPPLNVETLIRLVNAEGGDEKLLLTEDELKPLEALGARLTNRKLKGQKAQSREDVLALSPEEIDLARALFLFDKEKINWLEVRQYEASLDLMALQILARLPAHPTDLEKVRAISDYVFHEMGFRFPPHSLYAKDIDLYTFLPSVLDNRRGVCLGVSILYLCLAQRLDLPLEIVTPPGHIYVRYRDKERIVNIETTARGIHLPSETYLGVNTRKLKTRNIKEVIGLSFVNQAAVHWHRENWEQVAALYEKALPFLPDDPLLKMLYGYSLVLSGREDEGKTCLKEIENLVFDEAVAAERLPSDYLQGRVDASGIQAVFLSVDKDRASIFKKQEELKGILKKYPLFRDGHLHLATTYLQLGRLGEALDTLKTLHKIDPDNPTVEYYLAALSFERLHYPDAAYHFKRCAELVEKREHSPKALEGLQRALRSVYPE